MFSSDLPQARPTSGSETKDRGVTVEVQLHFALRNLYMLLFGGILPAGSSSVPANSESLRKLRFK